MVPVKKELPVFSLAPMAGYTDAPFRRLCFEGGLDLATTEMVSAKALYYGDKKTRQLMYLYPEEGPVALQLFGSEPEIFRGLFPKISRELTAFKHLEVNMGCPAPKIVKTGAGSALLNEPETVREILKILVAESPIPVAIKIRKGFLEGEETGLKIAEIAQEEGVSLITVHGRSREAYYRGKSDRAFIGKVISSVDLPVFANGDIATLEDVLEFQNMGARGMAIGRGALGRPQLFAQLKGALEGLPFQDTPPGELLALAKKQLLWTVEEKGDRLGVLEMRKHLIHYMKGLREAKALRDELMHIQEPTEVARFLDRIMEEYKKGP
ncbi:MAG: tRNA-dihydrouridine synthase [Tissierellia bacterium]|nr:tRNA-dihydrouridine synthase [Tissierellia bacterium]